MASSAILRRVALVRTNVSEELSASFIRVTRIGELETPLAVTSNRRTLRRNTTWEISLVHWFLSPRWRWGQVSPKRRFLQAPHGVTSQKTPFFIVTAVNTSNLIHLYCMQLIWSAIIKWWRLLLINTTQTFPKYISSIHLFTLSLSSCFKIISDFI
jgi:hypothetical protein